MCSALNVIHKMDDANGQVEFIDGVPFNATDLVVLRGKSEDIIREVWPEIWDFLWTLYCQTCDKEIKSLQGYRSDAEYHMSQHEHVTRLIRQAKGEMNLPSA